MEVFTKCDHSGTQKSPTWSKKGANMDQTVDQKGIKNASKCRPRKKCHNDPQLGPKWSHPCYQQEWKEHTSTQDIQWHSYLSNPSQPILGNPVYSEKGLFSWSFISILKSLKKPNWTKYTKLQQHFSTFAKLAKSTLSMYKLNCRECQMWMPRVLSVSARLPINYKTLQASWGRRKSHLATHSSHTWLWSLDTREGTNHYGSAVER